MGTEQGQTPKPPPQQMHRLSRAHGELRRSERGQQEARTVPAGCERSQGAHSLPWARPAPQQPGPWAILGPYQTGWQERRIQTEPPHAVSRLVQHPCLGLSFARGPGLEFHRQAGAQPRVPSSLPGTTIPGAPSGHELPPLQTWLHLQGVWFCQLVKGLWDEGCS